MPLNGLAHEPGAPVLDEDEAEEAEDVWPRLEGPSRPAIRPAIRSALAIAEAIWEYNEGGGGGAGEMWRRGGGWTVNGNSAANGAPQPFAAGWQ